MAPPLHRRPPGGGRLTIRSGETRARRRPGGVASGHGIAWPAVAVLLTVLAGGEGTSAGVRSLSIQPGKQTKPPGVTLQYEAIAQLTDGKTQDVTKHVDWLTDDDDLASFDPDVPGSLRTRRPGTVQIGAILLGARATTTLEIDPGPLVRLETRPSRKRLELDRPVRFRARLVYESGYREDVTEAVRWSSTNPDVARVSNGLGRAGRVVPSSVGETIIRARYPTGLENGDDDGETEILEPIERIRFDETMLVLGRGMTADLEVLGFHGETDVFTRLDDDIVFSTKQKNVIDLVASGDGAGHLEAKRFGFAWVTARDELRKLGTPNKHALLVVVPGDLEDLEILPNPFRVNAADTRNAKVFGVLSSGHRTADLRKVVEWLVDDPEIARVGNGEDDIGVVEGLEAGTTTLMARHEELDVVSTAVDNLVVRGEVVGLEMEPAEVVLGLDLQFPLRAYAMRDDETRSNVSTNAEWSVDPEGIVEVDESGLVTALANGRATVTALDPKTGHEASARVRVAGRLTSLEVEDVRLEIEDTKKASAIGRLSSGLATSDLRPVVEWSVQNGAFARVGDGTPPEDEDEPRLEVGEVLGIDVGTTTLTAREPITGLRSTSRDNLTVRPLGDDDDDDDDPGDPDDPDEPDDPDPPPLVLLSVVIEPGNDGQVAEGQTVIYKARATRSDGSERNVSEGCTWTIDDPSIAVVDDELPKKGGVTGVRIGTTTVRVSCDGLVASGPVEVVGDVIALVLDPSSVETSVPLHLPPVTSQFRATVIYSGGGEADVTRVVDWSSTNPDVASVDDDGDKGQVTFHQPGEALIFAVDATGHVGMSLVVVRPGG